MKNNHKHKNIFYVYYLCIEGSRINTNKNDVQ